MKKTRFKTFKFTIAVLCFALFIAGMNVFAYEYSHLDVVNTLGLIILSAYIGFYIGVKVNNNCQNF